MAGSTQFLGKGLLRPFRRDAKNDFANGSDVALVRACVGQVLGTAAGELPWRGEFGSQLERLRHMNQGPVMDEMARIFVTDALKRWEPRVRVRTVRVQKGDRLLTIELLYDVITANVAANQVVVPDVSQTVNLPLAA